MQEDKEGMEFEKDWEMALKVSLEHQGIELSFTELRMLLSDLRRHGYELVMTRENLELTHLRTQS